MSDVTAQQSMASISRQSNNAERLWPMTRQCLLTVSLVIACQSALAQAMYRIKPLGYLGGCTTHTPWAIGLNAADQVTGNACNANGDDHAFLWKNNGTPMMDLGPDEVGSTSHAVGINASGQVGGSAQDSTGSFAFLASGYGTSITKIYNTLGGNSVTVYGLNDLGQLTGEASIPYDANTGVASAAFVWKNNGSPMVNIGVTIDLYNAGVAINNSGQITGSSYYGETPYSEGFVWPNNGKPLIKLPTGGSFLINASGEVSGTGTFSAPGGGNIYQAFVWKPDGTPLKSLGTLTPRNVGQSYARALNDSGQIVGGADTVSFSKPHAFVWLNDGTRMKDLGTLGGTTSQSNDINASGQVTGSAYLSGDAAQHAFLWRHDGTTIQDLNALIDPTDPLKPYVTLTNAEFINDVSDIVAHGTDSRTGRSSEYLLQGTVLTLSPRSLAFGNHPIHTTSAAKSVTMTNTSPKVVVISSIALTGAAANQFASTNNCGSSMVGHATCTIKVTFKPTTKAAKSATLNVNGGGGGLRAVKLTGTGT